MSNKYIVYVSINNKMEGAEKSLISLQRYIRDKKGINTITIIPSHGPIEKLLKENEIEYMVYPFRSCVNNGNGLRYIKGFVKKIINMIHAYRLSKKLKLKNVITVHSNTITTDFGFYLAKAMKTKHIWHIREFGKLDFNYDFDLGYNYIRKCTSHSDKIICNSQAVLDYYSKYIDKNLLTYVYNGVDKECSGEPSWDNNYFNIVLAGRLSPEKRQIIAIEACSKMIKNGYEKIHLDLYGAGVEYEVLKEYIKNNNLNDYVTLKGYSNNIPFSNYNLGLMCSNSEAFGRVTVEYMINYLPVIGANSGGTKEIIIDNETGFLFKVDDSEDLFQKIKSLYLDRERCRIMGLNGHKRALKYFSQYEYCSNIYKVYEDALGGSINE